jgi:hypothetical protein
MQLEAGNAYGVVFENYTGDGKHLIKAYFFYRGMQI